MHIIGEIAASIGHKIRNPFTTVHGFLQRLGNKEEFLPFKEYSELMLEELNRANSIISEFLLLSNLISKLHTELPLLAIDLQKELRIILLIYLANFCQYYRQGDDYLMQSNKTCQLVEQYLGYLIVIKGRSENTVKEYRTDLLMFLNYVMVSRNTLIPDKNYSGVNLDFIKTISLNDMYSFITHCQTELHASAGTRARKIVSIRQFWKYLKTKAHLIDNNIAEELETPKLPKRIPKYLSLEESVRLLIQCENSPRDHNIITIFLNCALRLSELASLNINQVDNEVISVVGKGNKERKIFLTPAAKKSINKWLQIRSSLDIPTNALFISRNNRRMTTKAIQNVVKKYVIASGLNPKSISTHKLRHTAATLMYKYGRVDIRSLQQILGHESVATTEIYTHIDEHQLQSAVNSNPLAMMFN